MSLPLTERVIQSTYDALAEAFGDIPGLLILWLLPPIFWSVIFFEWLGIVYAIAGLVVVAILWGFILLVVGTKDIH